MIINREELAWAAGLFDGEGYVGVVKYRKKYASFRLTVAQNDRQVLDRFKELFGFGQVLGPYDHSKYKVPGGPHYAYAAQSFEHVQAIITMLYSFLSPVKKEQSLQALKQYNEWYLSVNHVPGPKKEGKNDKLDAHRFGINYI